MDKTETLAQTLQAIMDAEPEWGESLAEVKEWHWGNTNTDDAVVAGYYYGRESARRDLATYLLTIINPKDTP